MMKGPTANEEDKPTVDPKLLEAKRNEVLGEIQRMSNREQLEREVKIAMRLPTSERIQKYQSTFQPRESSPGSKSPGKTPKTDEIMVEDVEEGGQTDWTPNTVASE